VNKSLMGVDSLKREMFKQNNSGQYGKSYDQVLGKYRELSCKLELSSRKFTDNRSEFLSSFSITTKFFIRYMCLVVDTFQLIRAIWLGFSQ
jgi:hypothetical protein